MRTTSAKIIVLLFIAAVGVGIFTFGSFFMEKKHAASQEGVEQDGYWTCAMHPQVHMDHPGPCPICGMPLHFKATGAMASRPMQDSGAMAGMLMPMPMTPGNENMIDVSDTVAKLIGVATARVMRDTGAAEIRTVGRVEVDERKIVTVHTKVQGWIENLAVDFAGQNVVRGRPLLTIYSPELLATEEEYLIALEAQERMERSPDPDARERSLGLRAAAARRLALFDVPAAEIDRLSRQRRANRTVTVPAPASGYVTEIMVRRGMEVTPDKSLYNIADLSSIVVTADVYENEMTDLRSGIPVDITIHQIPGRTFRGTVDYVYPFLEAQARTNKIRITLPNPGFILKPGMYGDVIIHRATEPMLTVPLDAVIRTGTRDIVYVEHPPGAFARKEVKLGPQRGNRYVVLEGLNEGDVVVSGASFFLDSEESLRSGGASMPGMPGMSMPASGGAAGAPQSMPGMKM